MPLYFIETIVEASRNHDYIGTTFRNTEDAMKAALWALIDIVHDETEVRTDLDLTVIVKDPKGTTVFQATLQAGKRFHSEISAEMPVLAKTPPPAFHLST